MTVKRKATKAGNSVVVSLPADYREKMNIANGDELDIRFDENTSSIVITKTPTDRANDIKNFVHKHHDLMELLKDK
ncbi:AbrB/MazE/SpoVT family DNA-binding domain-containing protein [Weissella confusa]|uniref:AbrB/MazE/SpoVT family DNA-binding domain-containing protein n=1 Tax=Weissella confusa TaxID=1583 RepID=UPI00223AF631|nr:AbrB/MazE/SpoVT family DNA-binding domain-containing protein [Weissella confusa]